MRSLASPPSESSVLSNSVDSRNSLFPPDPQNKSIHHVESNDANPYQYPSLTELADVNLSASTYNNTNDSPTPTLTSTLSSLSTITSAFNEIPNFYRNEIILLNNLSTLQPYHRVIKPSLVKFLIKICYWKMFDWYILHWKSLSVICQIDSLPPPSIKIGHSRHPPQADIEVIKFWSRHYRRCSSNIVNISIWDLINAGYLMEQIEMIKRDNQRQTTQCRTVSTTNTTRILPLSVYTLSFSNHT